MSKYLVIVESPAKIKTISKFLGSNYKVVASKGHVRDLPKSSLGIDTENDFEPKYITIRGKGEILSELRKEVKKADKIYLATDPDREGEAISWHLTFALKLDPAKTYRITFNEITKDAVKESIKNAREIDMDLVDAQQGRRALDRLVGYKISPVLWAKVKGGLSAGRVQSVALKMIVDREKEIDAFVPEEYWSLDANLDIGKSKNIVANFYGDVNGKIKLSSKTEVDKIINETQNNKFEIDDIKLSTRSKKPPLPFTTSSLQQEAFKALNFGTAKTMRTAQQLYEGIQIKGEGTVALITYLRTDSTRVSDYAMNMAREYITNNFGKESLGVYKTSNKSDSKVQDAHEAIRPTDVFRIPNQVKEHLSRDQYRLYTLIWKRFVASQMANSISEITQVKIKSGDYYFTSSTSRITSFGFMNVYSEADEVKEKENVIINKLTKDIKLDFVSYDSEQHFTKPKPHYTEASLVKALEENGIGRPSTYAPTISTIIGRRYIAKENKNLYLTEIGEVVDNIMEKSFSDIVDISFTAKMEKELDLVEEGKMHWKDILREYYPSLEKEVNKANEELEKVTIADEVSDEICEKCGANMVIKYGPFGKFLACPNFPDCRNTKPYLEKIGVKCPKCGKEVVKRRTKKGRIYYGCEDYENCDFMSWKIPGKDNNKK